MKHFLAFLLLAVPITLPSQINFKADGTGATTRKLSAKLGDVVSVLDFGADATGATDSTTAVANAYAATAVSGACIYFPAGTYKFNLVIARIGVCIQGSGRSRTADIPPLGGSIFTPADLTKPIIQVGDGTTLVEKTTIRNFSMKGDGTFTVAGTSTSDGIVINGAYNTIVSDFEIGDIGGKSIYVTSSATRASAYNQFINGTVIEFSRYGTLVDYGSLFTAATYFDHVNWSPSNIGSGDVSVRIEGTSVELTDCWVQALDGHGHVYLFKDAGGRSPGLRLNGTTIDTAGNTAYTSVDINIGGAHRLINWYVTGAGFFIGGNVRWDDATVVAADTATSSVPPMYRFGVNAKIQQTLFFDINTDSGGLVYNDVATPAMSFKGKERTTGGTTPYMDFAGGHFRVPGTFGQSLQIGSAAAVWKNATTKRLHYRNDFAYPGNDIDGLPLSPLQKALAYSASMTPVMDSGSWQFITATNGTAFTINAPQVNAVTTANLSGYRLTFTISNTSGGALGVATWNANYKMGAAWVQPATGFNRSVEFLFDGTSTWYEVSRSAADVTN